MPRKPQRPKTAASNQLRIIGGDWRGRKLNFPDLPGLRPTPDRIRETLFNWLQAEVVGARCLDLFTGSGALGLEALSRGAASATLIDSAAKVVSQIRVNLSTLGADQGEVIHADASQWLARGLDGPAYDLVFMDPPFRKEMLKSCCENLETGGFLTENAAVYIEAERELQPLPVPANWQLHRQKQAGQVGCYLFYRQPTP